MTRRLVVPRLEGGIVPPAGASTRAVDPPGVAGIRVVFGVGGPDGEPPDDTTFKPTYTLSLPVFSIGGLDPDGVYEFDAAMLFEQIRRRSLRRKWGARLEIELNQAADTVSAADIYVMPPFSDETLSIHVLGRTGRGTTLPGGGRTIVVATTLVQDSKRLAALGGNYEVSLRDSDPDSDGRPNVASLGRVVPVDLTRFEFEG